MDFWPFQVDLTNYQVEEEDEEQQEIKECNDVLFWVF